MRDTMDNPPKFYHVNDLFIIATPSSSGKADIDTIRKLDQMPYMLQKGFCPVVAHKKGIARARSECLRALKDHLDSRGIKHEGHARIFWLDDDCMLDESFDIRRLAAWIKIADKEGLNLTANYKQPWHDHEENVIFHSSKNEKGEILYNSYSDEELSKLEELAPLPDSVAGMGFCYLDMPLDYKFHESGNGEDITFMQDVNMKLNYMPVRIFHAKTVYI